MKKGIPAVWKTIYFGHLNITFPVSLVGVLKKDELALRRGLRPRWSNLFLSFLYYKYYLVVLKAFIVSVNSL